MRKLLVFLFMAMVIQLPAQEITLLKGRVQDSLKIRGDVEETYSLYLPMAFQGNNPMPIIFVFDPLGRGKNAAQLFKSAAEEQGYIIASSNAISSEKDLEENIRSAARLIQEIIATLPVDLKSISVAGFSEGAEVATSIPVLLNDTFGVIAVGGQQIKFDYLDDYGNFSFVGIVGEEEMASYRMGAVANELDLLGFPTTVYTFNGGHEWPNPSIISSAVGTLTLQAMKKGLRPENRALVNSLYENDLGWANKLISTGSYLQAYRLLEILEEKYAGLRDVSEIEDKQDQLRDSRNFQDQERILTEVQEQENRLLNDYIHYLNEDVATANFENLGWWNFQKLRLREFADSKVEAEANMGLRLLEFLDELVQAKRIELKEADAPLEQKLFANMLQTVFDQTNFEAYKNVISLSAKDGDFSTALFYLEEMLKNGYEDMEALYDIEGTLGLKFTEDFNWLLNKYLGDSKYYDVTEETIKK